MRMPTRRLQVNSLRLPEILVAIGFPRSARDYRIASPRLRGEDLLCIAAWCGGMACDIPSPPVSQELVPDCHSDLQRDFLEQHFQLLTGILEWRCVCNQEQQTEASMSVSYVPMRVGSKNRW
jgi:hypothetical protein